MQGSKGKSLERLLQKSLSVGTHEVGGVVLLQPPPPSGSSSSSSGNKVIAERTSSSDGGASLCPAGVSNPGTPSGAQSSGNLEAEFAQLELERKSSSEGQGLGRVNGAAGAGGDDWGDFVG